MPVEWKFWSPKLVRYRIRQWCHPGDRDSNDPDPMTTLRVCPTSGEDRDDPHPMDWLVRVWKSSHDEELSLACAENILDEDQWVRAAVIAFFNCAFDPRWYAPDDGTLLDAATNHKELFHKVRDPWRPHDRVDLYVELTHVLAKRVRPDEPQALVFLQNELLRPDREVGEREIRQSIVNGLMGTDARAWVLDHVGDLVRLDAEVLEPILLALARSQQESLFRKVVDIAFKVMGREALLRYARTKLRKAWEGRRLELSPDTVIEQLQRNRG